MNNFKKLSDEFSELCRAYEVVEQVKENKKQKDTVKDLVLEALDMTQLQNSLMKKTARFFASVGELNKPQAVLKQLYGQKQISEKRGGCRYPAIPVCQFDLNGNFIKEFPSIYNASETMKIGSSSISCCTRGLKKQAGGFVWKRKADVKILAA